LATDRDSSVDLIGAGKLAKAIPPKAWEKLVTTACDTFTRVLAPITQTTSGLGRLIQAWFDRLVDAQKVLAAETLSTASSRASSVKRQKARQPSGSIMIAALTAASTETNETLRDLWSNLLAQEISGGEVHPEFVDILKRISVSDAKVLAKIARQGNRTLSRVAMHAFRKTLIRTLVAIDLGEFSEGASFSHEHLARLNLIERRDGLWNLTLTGRAFIEAVSDPTVLVEENKG
jgi:hypothetical protein